MKFNLFFTNFKILLFISFVLFFLLTLYYSNVVKTDVLLMSNWGGNEDCLPFYSLANFERHVVTDVCQCKYNSWVYKELYVDKNFKYLKVAVCSDSSGSDGVQALVFIDGENILNFKLESNSCTNKIIDISNFSDSRSHIFNLTSNSFGICDKEFIKWSKVVLN